MTVNVARATIEDIKKAVKESKTIHMGEDIEEGLKRCLELGRAYTVRSGHGEILAVIGGTLYWPGVATLSAIITTVMPNYPLATTKAVSHCIACAMNDLDLHRVEIQVKSSYVSGQQWAQLLGFEAEGILKKYGPNKEDYTMYARVK